MNRFWVFSLCLVLVSVSLSAARDFTFTLKLGAGRSECFYDYIHEGAFLEIEYQVIEGGDLDINFMVTDPNKKSMVMEPHSMDGLHGIDIKITGEYEICLDNSFSRMTDKLVFFDVIIEDDSGETEPPEEKIPYQLTKEGVYMDMKTKDLMEKLDGIGKKLSKVVQTQNYFQARESRHRHTSDSNHTRVQWWSLLECSFMVSIGVLQVFLIRSLFKTTRKDKIRT
ncbi:transmembrane emp24 domain-containing protein 1-like [Halichondria panicea]|uniref:transmembrane emp24 domain-containing protein 1-like n=1 Tax=Halichondria panicea TaxID=6063 RepID=UPI00312B43F6